jgi:hypothetical protein
MSRADESYDVYDNTSNNSGGGSGLTAPMPGSTVPVIATGRPTQGVINKGPYLVTAQAGVQTPGPALVVTEGNVRVHALSTNTRPVTVSVGRDTRGGELSPDREVIFPATNLSQIYMTPQVNGEGVEFTVKE